MALSIKSLTGLRFSCHDLFSCFSLKTNYHYILQYPKINQPGLHALKKYASGLNFSLLHGSWLCQDSFSCFSHLINYPYRWRHPKIDQSGLHALKNMPLDQVSASYMAPGSVWTHFPVSTTKQTTPIDGAFQKQTYSICRALPETQFSKASCQNSKL